MTWKKVIRTETAPAPIGPYNQAIYAGNTLYVSGQIALDPISGEMINQDFKTETEQVMRNLGEVLTAAGFDFRNVVKCTIFLTDMDQFPFVNEVYGKYFDEDPPARETVQVSRLPKNARVEISAIAVG